MLNLIFDLVNVGEANFTAIPQALMDKLMLPNLWISELLATLILLMICLIPTLIFSKNIVMGLVIGFIVIYFCTALGWLDGWITITLSMIVSALWSFGTLKSMLGGN